MDPLQQLVDRVRGRQEAAQLEVRVLPQRRDRVVVQWLRDRQVNTAIVHPDRHAAQVARERLGDHVSGQALGIQVGDVDERYLQLFSQSPDQVPLRDRPVVHEDLADATARPAVLGAGLLDELGGDDRAQQQHLADAQVLMDAEPHEVVHAAGRHVLGRGLALGLAGPIGRGEEALPNRLHDLLGSGHHPADLSAQQRAAHVLCQRVERIGGGDCHDAVAVGNRDHAEVAAGLLGEQPRGQRVDLLQAVARPAGDQRYEWHPGAGREGPQVCRVGWCGAAHSACAPLDWLLAEPASTRPDSVRSDSCSPRTPAALLRRAPSCVPSRGSVRPPAPAGPRDPGDAAGSSSGSGFRGRWRPRSPAESAR